MINDNSTVLFECDCPTGFNGTLCEHTPCSRLRLKNRNIWLKYIINLSFFFLTSILTSTLSKRFKKWTLVIRNRIYSRLCENLFHHHNLYFISVSEQNSDIPFLRNEFSKILKDIFTVKILTDMSHINDQTNT